MVQSAAIKPPAESLRGFRSLWDVLKFDADTLMGHIDAIYRAKEDAKSKPSDEVIPREESAEIAEKIEAFRQFALRYELTAIESNCATLHWRMEGRLTWRALYENLLTLTFTVTDDFTRAYIMYVEKENLNRLESEHLALVKPLADVFPDGVVALINANKAYAVGLWDACVFHSMQALEYGLRAMSEHLGCAWEDKNWQEVINTIEGKIGRIQKNGFPGKPKPVKNAHLQELSEAAKEFSYFKDGWRNYVSHGKDRYDELSSLSVVNHVDAFMRRLAVTLSAAEGVPLIAPAEAAPGVG